MLSSPASASAAERADSLEPCGPAPWRGAGPHGVSGPPRPRSEQRGVERLDVLTGRGARARFVLPLVTTLSRSSKTGPGNRRFRASHLTWHPVALIGITGPRTIESARLRPRVLAGSSMLSQRVSRPGVRRSRSPPSGRAPGSGRPRRFSVVASGTVLAPSDQGDPRMAALGSVGLDRRPRTRHDDREKETSCSLTTPRSPPPRQ